MVTLRERRSRPSYASMAEGLEDLSDEDEDDGSRKSGAGEGSGSGSGSSSKSDSGDELESSISSGGSSEFNPQEDGGKGGKTKGKGKAKARPRSGSDAVGSEGDSDDYEDEDEEDEDMATDEELDDEEIISVQSLPKQKSRPKKALPLPRSIINTTNRPRPPRATINASNYIPPENRNLPQAYDDLIKNSAVSISKSKIEPKDPREQKNVLDKMRVWGVLGFAHGPPTPFLTRLDEDPWTKGRSAKLRRIEQAGHRWYSKDVRRVSAVAVEAVVVNAAPWQAWQGEGWWKEMYERAGETSADGASSGPRDGGKGKERARDPERWVMRQEVRIGLDSVGRFEPELWELLSFEDAKKFLPSSVREDQSLTCHVGPINVQTATSFRPFDVRKLSETGSMRDGFVFSVGGPIWGLDWAPLSPNFGDHRQCLAVSTLPGLSYDPYIGMRVASDTPGSIQIWSMDKDDTRCEMVLCVDGGPVMEVKWMPLGAWDDRYQEDSASARSIPKIGIIAAVQQDGSVSFYPVPSPSELRRAKGSDSTPSFLRLPKPLLRLTVDDAVCTVLDWMSGERLVVGLSNGHIAVWDVVQALRSGDPVTPLPVAYVQVAIAPVKSVKAARCPPGDAKGDPVFDEDGPYVVCGAYDGTSTVVDIRDPGPHLIINNQRGDAAAVGFCTQLMSPVFAETDCTVNLFKIQGYGVGKTSPHIMHRGPVWDVTTSDYHTMMVSSSSDGSVILANVQGGFHRRKVQPMIYRRLNEMDYDVHSGQYRMLENFTPEIMSLAAAADRGKKSSKTGQLDPTIVKAQSWSPHVAVHRATWNEANGLAGAGWLATGMACGLVRVEWITGTFKGGVVPTALR